MKAGALQSAFELALVCPQNSPSGFAAGACTVEKPASHPPAAATAPAAASLSPRSIRREPDLISPPEDGAGSRRLLPLEQLRLRELVAGAHATMALAQSRAEFVTARGLLAGVVAALEIVLAPAEFAEFARALDLGGDTLAELRAIAGTETEAEAEPIEI